MVISSSCVSLYFSVLGLSVYDDSYLFIYLFLSPENFFFFFDHEGKEELLQSGGHGSWCAFLSVWVHRHRKCRACKVNCSILFGMYFQRLLLKDLIMYLLLFSVAELCHYCQRTVTHLVPWLLFVTLKIHVSSACAICLLACIPFFRISKAIELVPPGLDTGCSRIFVCVLLLDVRTSLGSRAWILTCLHSQRPSVF